MTSHYLHHCSKFRFTFGISLKCVYSSFHCRTPKPTSRATVMEDIWNSFLAGIFHLHSGDRIFVTLENIQTIRPGQADNFMGAFMLTP